MYAGNLAVRFEGREQRHNELHARASRLANALAAAGVAPQDRVAVLGDNAFETIEIAAACALGNFARTTLFTYNAPEVNRYLLGLVDARALIVQARHVGALASLLAGLELKLFLAFDGVPAHGAEPYEAALAAASADDPLTPSGPDDIHMVRFSSGTTGFPKGIWHSNARWMQYNAEWRWVTPLLTENSRYLSPASLSHLGLALTWGTLAAGGCIVPMASFGASRCLELMESLAITHAVAAPVMIRDMLAEPTVRTRDLSALQCLIYAGSPISEGTLAGAIEVFGRSLFQMYGQSEVAPATMLMPHQHVIDGSEAERRRTRSVGRPTPNSRVTIRDEEGRVLPPETVGEIAVDGPPMSGIWGDPEATAARYLGDGSILTRDMGYLDAEGFLYLVDRKDDMIVSGGFNIWPTELEEALLRHPAVAEACVFGVPDERWGETPKAAVVLRAGMHASEAELLAHGRTIIGGVKKVTSIQFVDALARNGTGKVLRHAMKEPWWSGRAGRIAGS